MRCCQESIIIADHCNPADHFNPMEGVLRAVGYHVDCASGLLSADFDLWCGPLYVTSFPVTDHNVELVISEPLSDHLWVPCLQSFRDVYEPGIPGRLPGQRIPAVQS